MKRPCLLNADTVGVLSYCESLSNAAVLSLDNSSLEDLDSFTVSLFDLSGFSYSVTYVEARYRLFLLCSFDILDNVVH